ncbi:MAG: hypothetical protein ACRELB_06325 [Polyangiaceae bacterium]
MNISQLVDEMFEAFLGGLGGPLAFYARDLPRVLRLASRPNCPWSDVFMHEVTLGAPALLAEGMDLPPDIVRDAVLAHALAVIDAFGTDRIEDDQVPPSAELLAVLGCARRDRDRAMVRIFGGPPVPGCSFAASDAEVAKAIRRERAFVGSARPVDLATYERESLGKQAPGLPASLALAHIAGWSDARCESAKTTLESIWLGLQMYDDVVDWEDDFARGGSWAVCLMKGDPGHVSIVERNAGAAQLRSLVLESGTLGRMLTRAVHHMAVAQRQAHALGAPRLAGWAGDRRARFETLCAAEKRNAGYAVRAHALTAWAGEVLA